MASSKNKTPQIKLANQAFCVGKLGEFDAEAMRLGRADFREVQITKMPIVPKGKRWAIVASRDLQFVPRRCDE